MSEVATECLRRRSLELLVRSLRSTVPGGPDEGVPAVNSWDDAWADVQVCRCAQDLEFVAWRDLGPPAAAAPPRPEAPKATRYRAKIRALAAALRQPALAELRRRLLIGELAAGELVLGPEEALLPAPRRAALAGYRAEGLREVCAQVLALDSLDESILCPFCGGRGARYAVLRDGYVAESSSTYLYRKPRDACRSLQLECAACQERWQEDQAVLF